MQISSQQKTALTMNVRFLWIIGLNQKLLDCHQFANFFFFYNIWRMVNNYSILRYFIMKHSWCCNMGGLRDCLKLVACSPDLKKGLVTCEKGNLQGWNIDQGSRSSTNESITNWNVINHYFWCWGFLFVFFLSNIIICKV